MLVDGHSLAYRAFYAMPKLTTRQGEPVNAVLGFTNMLLKSIDTEQPTHVAVSFDRGRPLSRTAVYADYKGGRDRMPEDLTAQLPVIEELVTAFQIPIYATTEHEADDCIGTLARRAEAEGFDEVVLVSGDLDLLQLVDAHVRVMATVRGITDTVRYDVPGVVERFGFEPARIPDFKALAGDSSDNIPGVEGIGKGTASKLIGEFGTVEAMLEHPEALPQRWRDRLVESAEIMHRFKTIATINTAVPLEIDWEGCQWSGVPLSARDLLERLEFRRVVERLRLSSAEGGSATAEEGGSSRRPDVDVFETDDAAEVTQRLQRSSSADLLGVSFVRAEGHAIEAGFATDPDHAIALGVACASAEVEQLTLEPAPAMPGADAGTVRALISSLDREAWTFDLKSLMVELGDDIDFSRWRDVGVASYLLESSESQKSLQAIAARHGTRLPPDAEVMLGKGAKAVPWSAVDGAVRARFAGETAAATLELATGLLKRLREEGQERLFLDVEMPLQAILARMERRGVKVDVPYLEALGRELDGELDAMRREICTLAGVDFNVNSPKQLGEVLFERLQIPGGRKTKVGQYVTDADTLLKLAPDHPVCQRIVDYREVAKLNGTYVEALPRLADADGLVHTSWNATVAATGRLSSSDPNVQNIPVRTPLGRRIRRAFVVSRPDRVLMSADYSQIELRVMAHLSGDARLVGIFRDGGDVHAATAAQVFGVPRESVTSDQRRASKEVNFGILYGMGPDALGQRIGVSRKEARDFIDRYLENFGGVRDMMERTVRDAEDKGYVETMLGRRRWLSDINSQNRMLKAAAERMATNAPIQGTAADLVKLAMVALDRELPEAEMRLQVHDELVFEVERERVAEIAPRVTALMAGALPMSVPIVVDVKVGENWAEMKPLAPPQAVTGA